MSASSNRIVKNTVYLYGKTIITMFVLLWTTRIILNSLGPVDFGIYDVVAGAIAMLGFLNVSMANTIQRFLNYAQGEGDFDKQRTVFNIGVVFHILIALIIVVILIVLMFILFNGVLNIPPERIVASKIVYLCLIVSTCFTILGVPYDAALNAHEDMLYYAIVGIIEAFLKLSVAFAVLYTSKDRLVVYGILMALIPIFSMCVMRFYCKRKYAECVFKPRRFYNKKIAHEMISFAGWNFVGTTSGVVGNHGNSIVLNHFYGATLNAVAGIANQMQGMLSVLSMGMLRALNPVIYKSEGEGDSQRMMAYSYKGCKYSYLLLALFAFPMILSTPSYLKLWLKDVPDWAVLFVRLQLIRALLEQLTVSLDRSLQATGHIREVNIILGVFNILPIFILSILYAQGFLPYWHFVIAITFMVLIPCVARIYYCKKYCTLIVAEYLRRVISPCFFISLLALGVGYFICEYSERNIVWVIGCSLQISLFMCFLSYFFCDNKEKLYIRGFVTKLRKMINFG